MDYLPIFAKLEGRACLVVGGGEVAWRKARMLIKAGASVTLVSPEADKDVQEAADNRELVWLKESFSLNTSIVCFGDCGDGQPTGQ